MLAFDLKQLGIDLEVKYFDDAAMSDKIAKRGEPFDIATQGWNADYADAASFLVPVLGSGGTEFGLHLDDSRIDRRLEAANRLTGEARRKAWADLDIDLMRDDPPWAPYLQNTRPRVRLTERRLLRRPARLRLRHRSRLQEIDDRQALTLGLARDARRGDGVARRGRSRAFCARRTRPQRRGGAEGRHVAACVGARRDHVDTALAYTPYSWPIGYATCAKLFNYPDAPGSAGTRLVPEVVDRFTVTRDGRTYTFTLKKTFRFHTGAAVTAQSFADAFNRDAQPSLKSPATGYMHEIVGASTVIDGKAASISGIRVLDRYRLQIRLTKPLGDFTARLTLPFFCPVLPNTPIDPAGIDNPAGSGPYYVVRASQEPAHRAQTQPVLPRRPAGERRPGRGDDRREPGSLPARRRARPDRRIASISASPRPRTERWRRGTASTGRTGGSSSPPRSGRWYLAFNHDRPAFKGPGQIPLKKAINYAIDRPALLRTIGYLAGKRTDQMLPPTLARPESIYPLGGANLAAARRWYARARVRPATLVLYTWNDPPVVLQAQVLQFDLRKLGIDLDVKYFDGQALMEKVATRGEPFDLVISGWIADYADGGSFLGTLLNGKDLGPTGNLNFSYFDDPETNARIEAANRLTGAAARRKAWADLDVDLMRDNPPWAPIYYSNDRAFVSKSFGCFLYQPVYGVDIAAVVQEVDDPQALTLARDAGRRARRCSWHRASRARPVARARPGRRGRAARCA